MSLPQNVAELFAGMPARLKAAEAADKNSVFHFDLSGEDGGQYTVKVEGGACTIESGLNGEAKCAVSATAADFMDIELGKLEKAGMATCPPKLGPLRDPEFWFKAPDGPRRKLANEKPAGKTIDYDKLLRIWREGGDSK